MLPTNASGLVRYRLTSICSSVTPSGFTLFAIRARVSPRLTGPYSLAGAAGAIRGAVGGLPLGRAWTGGTATPGAGATGVTGCACATDGGTTVATGGAISAGGS